MIQGLQVVGSQGKKIVINKDAIFDEKDMLQNSENEEKHDINSSKDDEHVVQVKLEAQYKKDTTQKTSNPSREDQHQSIASSKHKRTIKIPTHYGFEDLVYYAIITSSGDPTTFQEVVNSKEEGR